MKYLRLPLAALTCGLLVSAAAEASMVMYTVAADAEVSGSGGVMPGSAKATFDDGDTAGSVKLTLDLSDWVGGVGATGGAYVAEWFFQYDGATALTDLTFTYDSGSSGPEANNVLIPPGGFNGLGEIFAWSLDFPPPPGTPSARFTAGQEVVYTITGAGITADDFSTDDELQTGVRARSLGDDNENSGWFADGEDPGPVIPEPATIAIWSLLAVGFGLAYRKRR